MTRPGAPLRPADLKPITQTEHILPSTTRAATCWGGVFPKSEALRLWLGDCLDHPGKADRATFKAIFGHLSELSPRLLAELSPTAGATCTDYLTGGTPVHSCRRQILLRLDPGELVGYSGDAAGVDFVAMDWRTPPLGFANPAHYTSEMLHYVSPVPYFTPGVRVQLEAKLGSYDGTTPRTTEPRVGLYMQDVPGTAQGNWFIPGVNLSIPFQQPDPFMALVHDYVSGTEPIFSMGTSVRGMAVGVYGFTPRSSGMVNRDFRDVTADDSIYCYENFRAGQTAGKINLARVDGIVLITMPAPSRLKIEKQGRAGDTCDRLAPWAFTENATLFER